MPNDAVNTGFQSVLAPFIDRFLQEKHTCGYAYHEPIRILHRFDDFLVREGLATLELPRSFVRNWLAKKPHESAATQQQRITIVRQFTKFLLQTGYPAYVPDSTLGVRKSTFVPRMLTDEELRKFFHAVDALEPTARQTSKPQAKGESTYASTRERNAPLRERNLTRHDSRFFGPRRCQNNSNLRKSKSGNETKRA
jgi:site-specific recombinase XerD